MNKLSELSNSTVGSYHWYHTLASRIKHIGEFLKKMTPSDEHIVREWGESLYNSAKELIEHYPLINEPPESSTQTPARKDCERALEALYLEVDKSIAFDVQRKVMAALKEAKEQNKIKMPSDTVIEQTGMQTGKLIDETSFTCGASWAVEEIKRLNTDINFTEIEVK